MIQVVKGRRSQFQSLLLGLDLLLSLSMSIACASGSSVSSSDSSTHPVYALWSLPTCSIRFRPVVLEVLWTSRRLSEHREPSLGIWTSVRTSPLLLIRDPLWLLTTDR